MLKQGNNLKFYIFSVNYSLMILVENAFTTPKSTCPVRLRLQLPTGQTPQWIFQSYHKPNMYTLVCLILFPKPALQNTFPTLVG